MSRSKKFEILGNPVPLARARTNKGRFYDSQKQLKVHWRNELENQHQEEPFFCGPLFLEIIFFMPIPKHSRDLRGFHHHIRPDLSNLIKFIEDAAQGVLYEDDAIIASISAEKRYDNEPRTEFILTELVEL